MADPAVSRYDVTKDLKESTTVSIITEDCLTGISPAGDVVNSAFIFHPQRPRHDSTSITQVDSKIKV
jgi:hypothetical protein